MPDKLDMRTRNITQENIEKISTLFPHCVTEATDEQGKIRHLIDFESLKQELSEGILSDDNERYKFTWPNKLRYKNQANQTINKTLRPHKEESVNFDGTKNLYIEGDNLDALKLLRETYLGKVKMIYIDPPYNTGNDFIYRDNFTIGTSEYRDINGVHDEGDNRLFRNTDSNGRFHTDWLNMMYPRLMLARDLLREDGVIFISIDDNELKNLKSICDEIFGKLNFRNTILTRRRIKSLNSQFADRGLYSLNVGFEYILAYGKSSEFLMKALRTKKKNASSKGRWDVFWSNADRPTMRYDVLGFTPETGQWRYSQERAMMAIENYKIYLEEFLEKMSLEEYSSTTGVCEFIRRIPDGKGKNGGVQHWVAPSDTMLRTSNWTDIEVSQIGKEIDLPFDNPKSKQLLVELLKLSGIEDGQIVLDFFAGSSTTAHAVMELNAEDGVDRKYIMVQLPEETDKDSEAYKAGFKNICEIGKERIRRAGKQILEENKQRKLTNDEYLDDLDVGFRVLKIDSSNMKDVYYTPDNTFKHGLDELLDNVKEDRTPEDLLFQVMLELGVELSSMIEECTVEDKKVFSVDEDYLVACFDIDVSENVVTEIAKKKPHYAVMRDYSMSNDNVAVNFEQIFKTYSPETIRRVI